MAVVKFWEESWPWPDRIRQGFLAPPNFARPLSSLGFAHPHDLLESSDELHPLKQARTFCRLRQRWSTYPIIEMFWLTHKFLFLIHILISTERRVSLASFQRSFIRK